MRIRIKIRIKIRIGGGIRTPSLLILIFILIRPWRASVLARLGRKW